MSAVDKRTRLLEVNANEAGNQQLALKRNVEGPILDKRLAIAESKLGPFRNIRNHQSR
jgi:hypothetical protein